MDWETIERTEDGLLVDGEGVQMYTVDDWVRLSSTQKHAAFCQAARYGIKWLAIEDDEAFRLWRVRHRKETQR